MKRSEEKRIQFMGKLARNKGMDKAELVEHFEAEYDAHHAEDETPPTPEARQIYLDKVDEILTVVFKGPRPTDAQRASEAAARESRVYDVPAGEAFNPNFDPGAGRG